MKISGTKYQHTSEQIVHSSLTFVLREWKFSGGEEEVPQSDVRDVDGRVTGFRWHDCLLAVLVSGEKIRNIRSVRKKSRGRQS
jgi:hypothetical protein